jgi:ribosome-associated translation inhibitor RaiA
MSFRVHFHHVPQSDLLREHCERLAGEIREEFPEALHCEVSLAQDGSVHQVKVHVKGKDIDLASHAEAPELRDGVNDAFERVRRQLRTRHDKLISRGRHRS